MRKTLGRQGVKRAAATLTIVGTLLTTGVTVAQSASANTGGGGCRDKGYADETYGIAELPCRWGDGSRGIYGEINYKNPNNISIFPCAQLLKVNSDHTTTQVANFDCLGKWLTSNRADGSIQFNTKTIGVSNGTYVVQAGYWEYDPNGNLVYIVGAQGRQVQVFG
ncbi:hypothetical protein [Streptomyces collinus]|uniref:Uncharacterized protein n=1 Tax=Streptomyces collinus (strain DSM 40733 / Tue 365) TaxID=1214242 RepID=S5VF10_STRC3|nr:hypothetical protein [Streptomyces collinus]AGS66895.1 hypothetical protein B446_00265 [Streptomyces collinus Tu 365]AGS73799.1 hypothetical protein B446_35025 [Streptomyces collinus Tu 365]